MKIKDGCESAMLEKVLGVMGLKIGPGGEISGDGGNIRFLSQLTNGKLTGEE